MCSVPWGTHDKCGGYLEYRGLFSTMGDIMSAVGVIMSIMGDVMIHVGDTMSTVEGVEYVELLE